MEVSIQNSVVHYIENTQMRRVKAKKAIIFFVVSISTSVVVWLISDWRASGIALPEPDDTPEEILRTEIIIEARSPVDGKPLTASEYAELLTQLQTSPPPKLTPKIREQVFLLRIRKALFQIFPFLNL
ncbi:hypothetical protein OGM63_07465 [Plectonema radiosum NIES-515]|uniref:Glutathione S-transferase n=1 Tax=Plectonema radiosum NIES-515 TaxID=2986073 RepID=A0ABT3AW68_9CYAN|nr:hypothetical protein [Plectonema radiosum]MCV3213363.1 hypothetical protein [Plectonema radiosum NIES-515]